MARLHIEDSGESRTVDLDRDLVVLGRSKKCTVRLKDGKISSRHCQLCRFDGAWYLEDLHSKNKTLLNDQPVGHRTPLHAGDRISLGAVRLTFAQEEPVAAAPPSEVAMVLPWKGEVDPPAGADAAEGCGLPAEMEIHRRRPLHRVLFIASVLAIVVLASYDLRFLPRRKHLVSVPPTPAQVPVPPPPVVVTPPKEDPPPPVVSDPGPLFSGPLDLPSVPLPASQAALPPPPRPPVVLEPLFTEERIGPPAKTVPPQGPSAEFVLDAVDWLVRHQRKDGSWSCATFGDACQGGKCGGPGEPCYDVGVTSLALLALEGAGFCHTSDGHGREVQRGLLWLRDKQDPEGCFGPRERKYLYSHSIATLALLQDLHMTKSPLVRQLAQRGVDFILATQTAGGGWRYLPERKQTDTSVTTWMALCLSAAKREGITVPDPAWAGVRIWLLKKTDPASGRVGYRDREDRGARLADGVDKFPPQEAMAACGLLCRLAAGKGPGDAEVEKKVADRLRARLPEWDEVKGLVDEYYWFFGTLAGRAAGLGLSDKWDPALKKALIGHQLKEGCAKGSWDPVDPWGTVGGRVYATSLGALSIELLTDGTLEALRP